jgi:hypothetical protein
MELGLQIWILWAAALVGIIGAIVCAFGALLLPASTRRDEPLE